MSRWAAIAKNWSNHTSPVRPSIGDLSIYSEFIKKYSVVRPRTLLLGATPELRDLLYQHEAKVVIVDFSIAMLNRTTDLLTCARPTKERWIIGDWRRANDYLGQVDLVVGDLILRPIHPSQRHDFLRMLANLTIGNGMVILREQFRPLTHVPLNIYVETLRRKFKLTPRNFEICLVYYLLNTYSNGRTIDFFGALRDVLEVANLSIDKDLVTSLQRVATTLTGRLGNMNFHPWSMITETELLELVETHFKVYERLQASDYPRSETYPIFVLQPYLP